MASGLEAWVVRRQIGMSRAIVPALRSGFRAFGLSGFRAFVFFSELRFMADPTFEILVKI